MPGLQSWDSLLVSQRSSDSPLIAISFNKPLLSFRTQLKLASIGSRRLLEGLARRCLALRPRPLVGAYTTSNYGSLEVFLFFGIASGGVDSSSGLPVVKCLDHGVFVHFSQTLDGIVCIGIRVHRHRTCNLVEDMRKENNKLV
jgi:hypothetical protein